jgi:hypothetical protein
MNTHVSPQGFQFNSMFLQWCHDELILSFIFVQRFRFVGQDAASKMHHCRNTNRYGKGY